MAERSFPSDPMAAHTEDRFTHPSKMSTVPSDADCIKHPHPSFMERAIYLSRKAGVEKQSGGCFGCVIVKDGKIVGEGYNNVIAHNDPTWHGEIAAIRDAANRLGTPLLKDCVLYTSSEPCPMCMGACYWARITTVFYATTIADVKKYGRFEDEDFYREFSKKPGERTLPAIEYMREEAIPVWEDFSKLPGRVHY
ncbi:guaD [Scenedesmus sp. PABB004]|nr:guaD [Scenedesmus sp. PABB004]